MPAAGRFVLPAPVDAHIYTLTLHDALPISSETPRPEPRVLSAGMLKESERSCCPVKVPSIAPRPELGPRMDRKGCGVSMCDTAMTYAVLGFAGGAATSTSRPVP